MYGEPRNDREKEAQELAKGLNLTETYERSWYEDTWTETGVCWRGIADLIQRVREEKKNA